MIKKFRSLPRWLQRDLKLFFALCIAVALLDLVIEKQGEHWWNIVGFHSLYGFIACVFLVLVAKGLRRIVMRGEEYYD